MGSISIMRSTNRALTVLKKDGAFQENLMSRYLGAKIVNVGFGPGEQEGEIVVQLELEFSNGSKTINGYGSKTIIDGPPLFSHTESGVCGFNLEEWYDKEELKDLMKAAMEDENNDLDDNDRVWLQEDIDGYLS